MLKVKKSHNGKGIQSHNKKSFYTVCGVCKESEKKSGNWNHLTETSPEHRK